MSACRHQNLALLPTAPNRLRCRHCHLIIDREELTGGYCPECFEREGQRRADFDTVLAPESTRYQCEACGAIVAYVARSV